MSAEPRIGPLATAYVLLLVIASPPAARWTEPHSARRCARLLHSRAGAAGSGDEASTVRGRAYSR